MRAPGSRPVALIAAAGALALTLTSCASEGIYSIPLPGGADLGSNPMSLSIQFDDVLDLVPQSTVKVDGVAVGRVADIKVAPDGWTAVVDVTVNSSVSLPANATAKIEQTSLLGEKFVSLSQPLGAADANKLASGATIGIDRTRSSTDIEQVLGALSMLLTEGGVAQLAPIVKELNTALDGRTDRVRNLLEQANTLIAGLDQQKNDITRALDGLDTLTASVSTQTDKIDRILKDLPVATDVLEKQRPQLTALLTQLDRLGTVGTDVLNQSKDNLIADIRALRPTLQELAKSSEALVSDLGFVPTFPFPDGAEKIITGGSVNLFLSLDLSLGTQLSALGVGKGDPVYSPPQFGKKPFVDPANPYYNGNGPRPGLPTVSLLPFPPIIPNPVPPAGVPGAPVAAPVPANPLDGLLQQFGVQLPGSGR